MIESVHPLYLLLFIAAYIVIMFIFYRFGVRQWQKKVTNERARDAGPIYYALIILSFSAGALARAIQEFTGSEWANGLVPIFGGFFFLAMGWPLLFLPRQQPLPLIKSILSWALAAFIGLLAITCFTIGFMELLRLF
jgi:hypothetical protein